MNQSKRMIRRRAEVRTKARFSLLSLRDPGPTYIEMDNWQEISPSPKVRHPCDWRSVQLTKVLGWLNTRMMCEFWWCVRAPGEVEPTYWSKKFSKLIVYKSLGWQSPTSLPPEEQRVAHEEECRDNASGETTCRRQWCGVFLLSVTKK